jgi:WD40 repeat protein
MSDPSGFNLDGLDLDMVQRIDAVCRRFEADWRDGRRPGVEAYLDDVSGELRPALREELEAVERELRQSAQTMTRSEAGSSLGPHPQMPPASAGAEAATMAPEGPQTLPALGAPAGIHSDATVPPRDQATLDLDPVADLRPEEAEPVRIRYFGDYEILREIARGGMGVVFQARQMSLNRTVALKMILAGQLANESDILRFRLEAESAANLDHPGIVPIFEVGQYEGQHYFSMGFVEGQSLSHRLANGPLPSRQAAGLILKVAEAIEYAHHIGVVHRDLKPGNILVDRSGNPRVTDFGLAKKVQGDSGLTASGQIMGTPSFMAPEQAGGKQGEVGPPADVYALGSTLYCTITGRPPFHAATAMDTVIQVVSEDPVPPRRLNPTVDRDLETICLKCLEKEPARRYDSAAALGEDLHRYLGGEPIVARPVTAIERAVKWARRRPAIAGLAAALALALALGFSGMALLWARAEQNAASAQKNEVRALQAAQTETEAKSEAQKQAAIATEKAEALRRADYASRVNLAYQECQDSNITLALELLDGCPPDLRGWEWSYVSRQCHLDVKTFRESAPVVHSVAFSPDGLRIASGSGAFLGNAPGDLVVRNVSTGAEVFAHRGLPGGVHAVAFSPDGRSLATGYGPTLAVWDAASGRERFHRNTGSNTVDTLSFTPDSRRIVTGCGGEPGYTKIWDAATGDLVGDPLPGFGGNFAAVAVSPDGRQVAVTSAGRVDVWDLETRKVVHILRGHERFVYAVAFSPDGRYLASGGWDRTVRLWDRATGAEVRKYPGHEGFVRGLAFSPDSQQIVSGAEDKSVKLWSVNSDRELATLPGHEHYVMCVAFSPEGQLMASGGVDHSLKLWFATPTTQLTFQRHTGWVNSVSFSPDGRRVASGAGLNSTAELLCLWDAGTGEQPHTFPEEQAPVGSVVFSSDGRRFASAGADGFVKIRDAATGRLTVFQRGSAHWTYEPASLAFSPDSRLLALADQDGTVKVLDATTGQEVQRLKGHTANANGVAFSPDGRKLAAGSDDMTVKVWDTSTGTEILTLKGHTVPISSVAISPDGRLLASVGGISQKLGEVKIWDLATGRELFQPRGHTDTVSGVAFSPDGRRLATASDDRTIKLWDPATGQEVFTLRGHSSGVLCVAFSPDGQRIASGSIDHTAKVWDTSLPTADQVLRRPAALQVASLFRSLLLRNDVIDRIRQDPKSDSSLRALALQIAERFPEDPMMLNNTSWLIAVKPDRTAEDYRRALRYAEEACRLAPREATFVNTLGVARYRAGRNQDAVSDLGRSLTLNAARYAGSHPLDLAFLAMARHRLGQHDEARETLGQLREVMSRRPWSEDDESTAIADEAILLITGKKPPVAEVARFDDTSPVTEFAAVSPDGKKVLACSEGETMRLWDLESVRLIRRFEQHGGRLFSAAFTPDGRRALSAGQDKIVRLWDVDSGKLVRELKGHNEWVFCVAVSPDGRRVYSTSGGPDPWRDGSDCAVRVWDLDTGREIRKLEGHKGRVLGMSVSSDGRRVLTGGDTTVILWDAETGKEIRRLQGHAALISNVAFLPDGRRAVSGSHDRTVRLWDLESGQELHRYLGHPREVTWVAVSPDGRRLLSADYNGHELWLWDIEGRRLIRRIGFGNAAPTRGTFTPDGRRAVWCGSDGIVRMYRFSAADGADRGRAPVQPDRPDPGAKTSSAK